MFDTVVANVLSAVWYDVGYDIQSLNKAVCFEILIFFGWSISCETDEKSILGFSSLLRRSWLLSVDSVLTQWIRESSKYSEINSIDQPRLALQYITIRWIPKKLQEIQIFDEKISCRPPSWNMTCCVEAPVSTLDRNNSNERLTLQRNFSHFKISAHGNFNDHNKSLGVNYYRDYQIWVDTNQRKLLFEVPFKVYAKFK